MFYHMGSTLACIAYILSEFQLVSHEIRGMCNLVTLVAMEIALLWVENNNINIKLKELFLLSHTRNFTQKTTQVVKFVMEVAMKTMINVR